MGRFGHTSTDIWWMPAFSNHVETTRVGSFFSRAVLRLVLPSGFHSHRRTPLHPRGSIFNWHDNIEDDQWLDLLHPFIAVKDLYISRELVPHVTPTLQELQVVGERVTEVLPALQSLFLEVPPWALSDSQERFGQFVAARQLSSHPIAVSRWERE
jgi:hypothetical protein